MPSKKSGQEHRIWNSSTKQLDRKYIGNCFTFAVSDFLRNGGELYIEFWDKRIIPHFSVKRSNYIHDLEATTFIFYTILYSGIERIRHIDMFKDYDFKRFPLFKISHREKYEKA